MMNRILVQLEEEEDCDFSTSEDSLVFSVQPEGEELVIQSSELLIMSARNNHYHIRIYSV